MRYTIVLQVWFAVQQEAKEKWVTVSSMQWSHWTVLVSQLALTVAPYSWNLSVQCSYHSQFDEVVNLRTEPEALDVTALAFLHSQDSHAFKYIHSAY